VWIIVLCVLVLLLVLVIVGLAVKMATRKDDSVVLVGQAHAVDNASDVPAVKEAWGGDGELCVEGADVTAVAVDDAVDDNDELAVEDDDL
jgi:hypothetical protein